MSSASGNTGVFGYIGRRLALLNVAVVVILIAVVGIGIVLFSRYTLLDQADQLLVDQAATARLDWAKSLEQGTALPVQVSPPQRGGDDGDDDEHEAGEELLDSGDVIVLGFDSTAAIVANPRGLQANGLPDLDAVALALSGESSFSSATVSDGHDVRIYTAPIESERKVVGAVQVIRSTESVNSAIRTIELAALFAALIGALGALPAGLFLARRAMRPIDQAFQRQQEFIADASHELRTPLSVIRANTELQRRTPNAPVAERDAELAVTLSEVDRMARMIDELLILARSDAGRLPFSRDIVDLAELVRGSVEPMTQLATAARVTLKVSATGETLVTGDEDRLAQVLRILVGNAISYTPAGGLITVAVAKSTNLAEVTVRDTGIGMTADERRRVFDRFYRGDRSRSRSTGGVGLGLSIAQVIVDAHDGSLEIESEPGIGTTVRMELPLARS